MMSGRRAKRRRITYHLQNLCMRDSRETPTPLEPGKRYKHEDQAR